MAEKSPWRTGDDVALTVALGRAGHSWETLLLAQIPDVVQAHSLVDLLVAAEVQVPDVIVVGQDFPRLTDGLSQLRQLGRVVIVGDSPWADCPPAQLSVERLRSLLAPQVGDRGQVVAVWGPQGSWGVTSVAIGLARSLCGRDRTLLIDANVHVPAIGDALSQPLGGLLQGCLSADRGSPELSVRTDGPLSVMTGVEPRMYPSVHPAALQQVLESARRSYPWVVADTDSAVDAAGDIGLVPDWTSATAVTLREADQVLIVIGESDVALARLWRALPAVAELMAGRATVVVNRCSNPRATTAKLAQRLGDYLPEAAVGWIGDRVTEKSLAPIVAEVARQVTTGAG